MQRETLKPCEEKWGKPTWLIYDTNQFYLNVCLCARSWQMQEGPSKGIWKIVAIESVGAFRACSYFDLLGDKQSYNLWDFDNC